MKSAPDIEARHDVIYACIHASAFRKSQFPPECFQKAAAGFCEIALWPIDMVETMSEPTENRRFCGLRLAAARIAI